MALTHADHLRALVLYGYGVEDCQQAGCEGPEMTEFVPRLQGNTPVKRKKVSQCRPITEWPTFPCPEDGG
jgi:hypothetical protein